MGLKKLIDTYKRTKYLNKHYRLKPGVHFEVDKNDYCFALLPTITFLPAPFRWPGTCAVEVWWLNFHLCFGEWVRLDD